MLTTTIILCKLLRRCLGGVQFFPIRIGHIELSQWQSPSNHPLLQTTIGKSSPILKVNDWIQKLALLLCTLCTTLGKMLLYWENLQRIPDPLLFTSFSLFYTLNFRNGRSLNAHKVVRCPSGYTYPSVCPSLLWQQSELGKKSGV